MEAINQIVMTGVGGTVAKGPITVNEDQPADGYYFFPDGWKGQRILVVSDMEEKRREQMVWVGKRLRLTGKLYCMLKESSNEQLYFIHYSSSEYESEVSGSVSS